MFHPECDSHSGSVIHEIFGYQEPQKMPHKPAEAQDGTKKKPATMCGLFRKLQKAFRGRLEFFRFRTEWFFKA